MLAPCFRLGPSCSLALLQTDQFFNLELEAEGGCEARTGVTWMTCWRACAWECCHGHFVFVDPRNPRVWSCSCSGNTGFCCTSSALVAYVLVPEVLNTLLPAVPSQSSSKHCPDKNSSDSSVLIFLHLLTALDGPADEAANAASPCKGQSFISSLSNISHAHQRSCLECFFVRSQFHRVHSTCPSNAPLAIWKPPNVQPPSH